MRIAWKAVIVFHEPRYRHGIEFLMIPEPANPDVIRTGFIKALWKKLCIICKARRKDAGPVNHFTPRAQQIFALAKEEAARLNHLYISTEHLLLGLIKLGEGVAWNVLQKLGIDPGEIRQEVEHQTGGIRQGIPVEGDLPYTSGLKIVLALANREARALHHHYVGSEHILLGLLREGEGVAAHVLRHFKIDVEWTLAGLMEEQDPNVTPRPPE